MISAPSEDDYSFQQQLSALTGQDCHLGEQPNTVSALSFLMRYGNVVADSGYTSGHQDQEMQIKPQAFITCLTKVTLRLYKGNKTQVNIE